MEDEDTLHLLIIEDSPDDRADIRRMLLQGSPRTLKFREGHSGAEALRLLKEGDRLPDCVLLDFSLPDMNALEILQHLRGGEEMTVCPVVVLTGSNTGGASVIAAGAQDYLGKSWATPEILVRAIDNARERYTLAKERKRVADHLKVSEEFNRTVLQSTPDCVKVIDREGLILSLNEPGRCLLEVESADEVIGKAWSDMWPEKSVAEVRAAVATALSGELVRFEQFSPTFKGTPKWWDVQISPIIGSDGSIDRVVAVSRDITERREFQQALQNSSARLLVGLRASGVALAHIDYLTGSYQLSAEAARIFGLGDTELTTTREVLYGTFHPEDRPGIEAKIAEVLSPAGSGIFMFDHRIVLTDGEVRWVRANMRVFFEGEGAERRANRGILAVLDITESKRAEIELAEIARRKDEFLAMLAHELRNPLAPLLAGMEVLLASPGDTKQVDRIAGMMRRQVDQMSHLIDDLLDVSRINSGKIELQMGEVSVDAVIRQSVESIQPLINRFHHELTIRNEAEGMMLKADHHRLAQVISNLLSNAAKYTPAGGKIALRARTGTDGLLEISVADNGKGIPPEHQSRIFDLFDQGAEGPKDGLGIGLTLVKSLMAMHGGTISVASEGEGRGSEFTVKLPILEPPRIQNAEADHEATPRPEGMRVLIADDGKATADILGMFFELEGLSCRVVYDGGAAVKEAVDFHPDVACFDIGMPVMNGYEAAREIRPLFPDLYLVALSGWGSPEDRQKSLAAGFDEHLVKPVNPDDLRKLIRRVAAAKQ